MIPDLLATAVLFPEGSTLGVKKKWAFVHSSLRFVAD
jgi:hypothetical protein